MKFDWKHWLPHFITWFLLLILLGLNIWWIRRQIKRHKHRDKLSFKITGIPFPSKENDEGKQESDDK